MQKKESEEVRSLKNELEAAYNQCRLYEKEINRLKAELAGYEKKLVNISVMNRWKIGEYLHDSLAQKLNYAKILINFLKKDSIKITSELAEQCDIILQLIDEGINEVRNLSHDIIPSEIGEEGITEAFNYLKNQIEARHQITCHLELGEGTQKDIAKEVVTNLYLISQEAIKNAISHGEADEIKVCLFEQGDKFYLHVKDNGKGFNPSGKGGVGLDIMAFRAKQMGGTFRIRAAKEMETYSTYVTCMVPIESLPSE